jgi:hypothetical protein
MPAKSFSFSSPGVKINEIDKSQLQKEAAPVGPIIIGRAQRGPSMRPVTVTSYDEFVQTFGDPVAGGDSSGDVWRSGIPAGPTYGAYAAQAWLANSPTLTYVRLLGTQADSATASNVNEGCAGWRIGGDTSAGKTGSFGLFLFSSASSSAALTGTLAAVWYCVGTVPVLSGNVYGESTASAPRNGSFRVSSNGQFTVLMSGTVGVDNGTKKVFDFSPTSGYFIRKSFNTNPQSVNTDAESGITDYPSSQYGYWLGETFENDLFSGTTIPGLTSSSGSMVGIIAPLNNFHTARLTPAKEDNAARTGWIVSQVAFGSDSSYTPASKASKLFRFVAIDSGDWTRNNLKVTINNIVPPQNAAQKYGTFDVEIRRIYDTDANKKIVESFSGCTLDQGSPNYVARKIGDTKYSWDDSTRRLEEIGTYQNNSKFVRVEMYSDNLDSSLVPFGILGPMKYEDVATPINTLAVAASGFIGALSSSEAYSATAITGTGLPPSTFKFTFPSLRTRVSSSEDSLTTFKLADWGAATTRNASSLLYNDGVNDLLRLPVTGDSAFVNGVATSGSGLTYAWQFSLDDVKQVGSTNPYYVWVSGSKVDGTSYTSATGDYSTLLNLGINSFTAVFQGGIDGFNILEGEPLRNTAMTSNSTNNNNYVYYTYRRAIDTISDPEFVEANLISVPGLAFEPLTQYVTQIAEQRQDALAIIDISGDSDNEASYITTYERSDPTTTRSVTVNNVTDQIRNRNFNTSFGAAYYPWLQISDANSGKILNIPPSIAAIGAISYTDSIQAPWFAPAGFNRGGLSTGNAGINVVNTVKKLNQVDRDKLYLVNINPITSFPNEGIVIFGQKTLQAVPSALDRINVRRLMLYIERGIKLISNRIIFEPNVEDTWNNFKDEGEPFLADVKARFGVEDFRLILDSSTTTPDLVDQNILYAKVLVKPAKAIEFIALDFEISKSGANFNV